jgi:hypothetical protein
MQDEWKWWDPTWRERFGEDAPAVHVHALRLAVTLRDELGLVGDVRGTDGHPLSGLAVFLVDALNRLGELTGLRDPSTGGLWDEQTS